MTTEKLVKSPSGRPRRKGNNTRNRLVVKDKDPNYVYRVVNDAEGRVEDLMERGYELVPDKKSSAGGDLIDDPAKLGSVKEISVGGGLKGVVMRQRKDWYEEDQAEKEAYLKLVDESLKKIDPNEGRYGKVDFTRK